MLSVYTRHYPPCDHSNIHHRRCHCPKWIQGLLESRGFVRISAGTRSWEKAEHAGKNVLVRSFAGVAEIAATLVGEAA